MAIYNKAKYQPFYYNWNIKIMNHAFKKCSRNQEFLIFLHNIKNHILFAEKN